ncbi:hypothetical protein DFH09DRAFT_1093618 [Mycena vulgaris]|nr:hypothetical protein DFH09DRAFT_1093618 [Mycena vulgaris]
MADSVEGRNQTTRSKEDDSGRSIQLREAKPRTTVCDETKVAAVRQWSKAEIVVGAASLQWWAKLTQAETTSWEAVMTAFEKKWAIPVEAEESAEELKARIKSTVLRGEDLGKLVGPAGDEMCAHLRWATDMKPLVESIGDTLMLLKSDVRATLPLEVRSILPKSGLTTWEKFFKAVEELDGESIQDELERSRKYGSRGTEAFDNARGGSAELMTHQFGYAASPAPRSTYVYTSQPSPVQQQHHTPQRGPTPQRQSPGQNYAPATPQRGPPPHMPQMQQAPPNWQSPNNPFTTQTQPNTMVSRFAQSLVAGSPGSPSAGRGSRNSLGGDPVKDLMLARRAVANPRIYPATPAGAQQYQADMMAWDAKYAPNNGLAPDYATFPLTPGTVSAGSKECWTCGLLVNPPHFGMVKCKETGTPSIPIRESNVRTLIGNVLYPPGSRTPGRFQSGVSQITDELEGYNALGMYNVHQLLFDEQDEAESGNGGGLA